MMKVQMTDTRDPRGIVFNIQRFSIHDGPGIRTTVFLKGCNLRCHWCHNPESQRFGVEIEFFPEKCIACGSCVAICEQGAQVLLQEGQRIYLRDLCRECGACVEECFSGALIVSGNETSAGDVFEEIEKDAAYFQTSGGGVTFSGGEPLLQPDFLQAMLQICHQQGYHCAVDTAGNMAWERIERTLPLTDLYLYDIKAFDDATHRKYTGVSNERILENLGRLAQTGKDIWVRIPLVHGVNDTLVEIEAISDLLTPLKTVRRVEILPYHTLGSEKYVSLGKEYPAKGYQAPAQERMDEILKIFEAKGLTAFLME
jgi:glycyl-radical enzyme activating protein